MPRYFFTVRYLPYNADVRLLSGRCITALHFFLINNKPYDIGVAFPLWSSATMGNEIDFISDAKDKLRKFRQCDYFSLMEREGLLSITEVAPMDEQNVYEVRFVRNQGVKKVFPGEMRRRLKRARRRAEERGEVFNPTKWDDLREFDHFHSSFLQSHSTDQSFMLHIQREIDNSSQHIGARSTSFNTYGLATLQAHRGSVPMRLKGS